MADSATIQRLVDYYANLLIIQYHDKPKAKATIELFIEELLASGIVFDVQNGFSVDTAVGVQLDVIGKYVGINRFYKRLDLINFFSFTDYDESPVDSQKYGFSTYSTFATEQSNGTLTYDDIVSSSFRLDDDSYRTLIKLKIIQNNSNHSHKSIDDSIYEFFGDTVIPSSIGNMHMYYFVPSESAEVIKAAIVKEVLPRPMGVGLGYILQDNPMFSFSTYSYFPDEDEGVTGFSNYANYDTKDGETLTYSKIDRGF